MVNEEKPAYEPFTHWREFNCYLVLPGDTLESVVISNVNCFKCLDRLDEIITERKSGKVKRSFTE